MLHSKKYFQPWFIDDLLNIITEKHAAEGTPAYKDVVKICIIAIMKEYIDYVCNQINELF